MADSPRKSNLDWAASIGATEADAEPKQHKSRLDWAASVGATEEPEEQSTLDYAKGAADAAMRGGAGWMPFAEEMTAGIGALGDVAGAALGTRGDVSLGDAYRTRRDVIRRADAKAAEQYPEAFIPASLTTGVASAFLPGVGALNGAKNANAVGGATAKLLSRLGPAGESLAGGAVKTIGKEGLGRTALAAGQGALMSAGASEADLTRGDVAGFAKDTLGGGAIAGALTPAAEVVIPAITNLAGKGLKKLGTVLGGVSQKNIDAYLENPAAVRGAKSLEEIKDLADSHAAGAAYDVDHARYARDSAERALQSADDSATRAFADTRETIRGKVGEAKEALEDAWRAEVDDLRGHQVPMDHAKDLTGRLDKTRAELGTMSHEAEDALARGGQTYRKQDVLDLIDKIGAAEGKAAIGETRGAALQRFKAYRDRIQGGYGDELSGGQVRDLMRQIRADTDFDRVAGASSADLDRLRKSFTGGVSDTLKTTNPEYAAMMERMAPISQALERMSDSFGSTEKALAALEQIAKGKSPQARILEEHLGEYAKLTNNMDLLGRLSKARDANRILGSRVEMDAARRALPEYRQLQRAQKAYGQFDPKLTRRATDLMVAASPQRAAVIEAEDRLANALQSREAFRGWTPQTSENRLKSVMAGKSIENQKAVDALSSRTGLDFNEMLKNRRVADAFEKGYMHGSRNVNLWSIMGSLLGGEAAFNTPLMRFAGPAVGAAVDSFGPKMTQKALDGFMALRDSKFRKPLEEAAKRGKTALALTHSLLLKNEPAYQAIFADRGDEDSP